MSEQIESGSVWKQVYQDLGIPVLNSAAGYNVKCAYRKYVQALPQLLKADMQFVVSFIFFMSILMSSVLLSQPLFFFF